ncbi:BREX-3 system phosphatase PglZ [Vibrio parahaemolyticus]|uniref:BREX-3 system phosphatase PglZ n=1 Tax=Vibrio parahaemolyticus TaxID=670 RepID=UPI001E317195|nr:BREX-3 system phosphatase PglZ [Vibrio parahaemolyticus]
MRWQDTLIGKIDLFGQILYVIQDPDRLCFEPYIADKLAKANVTLFSESDPVALRMSFEEWCENCDGKPLIIRLDDNENNELYIPFDIDRQAIKLDFYIGEVISNFDVSVLRTLDPKYYQQLIDAVKTYRVGKLNKSDSLDFVLRHIYKIAPEIIQTEVDLVRLMIRKHYLGVEMPLMLEERLIQLLSLQNQFEQWDFKQLLPSRASFFAFLQDQWLLYLEAQTQKYQIRDSAWPKDELIVPFDDQDICVFIDNLFSDGHLVPVEFDGLPDDHWAWVGVVGNDEYADLHRFNLLLEKLLTTFVPPQPELQSPSFWGEIAHELGTLNALSYQLKELLSYAHQAQLTNLNRTIDGQFEDWIHENFGKLITLPSPRFPNMLHKVPDWLNMRVQDEQKVCLLVMDGMGFQQWARLRQCLSTLSEVSIEARYSFAWIPTITSISRQALFSGKRPQFFAESLLSTSKEEALWRSYWEDHGLKRNEVAFEKKVENKSDIESFRELVHSRYLKVAGFVINFIDEQMHGMKAGMSGLNVVLDDWLRTWQFASKIESLLEAGYEVVITSDHGNQEAIGEGWPNEGVKAETKGERVRLYKHTVEYSNDCSGVLEWPAKKYGLPAEVFPLVSTGSHAFIQRDKKIVGHGGISLHEVVVPFVTIVRNQHVKESKL